jgi:hypothetical protein
MRLILAFAIAGLLVALSLGIIWGYVNNHKIPRTEAVVALEDITDWLWPTSIMLMANENSGWLVNSAMLVISSLANAVVYAILALCGGLVWKRFVKRPILKVMP